MSLMPQKHLERKHRIAIVVCDEYSERTTPYERCPFIFEWPRGNWARIHEAIIPPRCYTARIKPCSGKRDGVSFRACAFFA
jgi:hypothetical protein